MFRRDLLVMMAALLNPRTPKSIKVLMAAAVLYFICPVDFIPDSVPVLGWLDDIIIFPVAVCGLRRLLPPWVLDESEEKADRIASYAPYILAFVTFILCLWTGVIIWALYSLITK